MPRFERLDLPFGYIEPFGDNEITLASTIPDPPKIRLVADRSGGHVGMGGISFCMLRADGVQEEVVLFQGKIDERERHTGNMAGEITLHLAKPGADNDAKWVRVFEMRHDGIRIDVPIITASGAIIR